MWQPEPEQDDNQLLNHAKESIASLELQASTLSTFRLLAALLQHSPTRKGREAIATDIIFALEYGDWPKSAIELADYYYATLLLPSNIYLLRANIISGIGW